MIVGEDVRVSPQAVISRPGLVSIGSHVGIDMGVYISTRATIGDYVHIAPYACIIGGEGGQIIMQNFTNIAAGSKIVVVSDDFREGMLNPIVPVKYRRLKGWITVMEKFSAVGINSVIMPGITMAEGSVLGANSLLTKNTEPWGIYVGSPAKLIGYREKSLILQAAKELGYA